jgi:putative peptide zinc metalloprotease protein
MATAADHTIEEPLNAVLLLRTDLRVELREFGGQPCCVIEDPLRAKFYRLGVPEYTFARLLDGTRTVRAAIGDAAGQLRELAFSECQALGICRWLLESQLVETPHAAEHRRLTSKAEDCKARWAWLRNPLCVRMPLLDPRAALDLVEPWLAWTLRKPFFFAWLAVCLYALGVAAANWNDLVSGAVVLLDRRHWWLLVVAWLALKLLHETYHALVCRKYGGSASEAGIFLMFFAPVPYVDVTSSWRFASKWHRIAVAAAGMYIELLLAALAIIVWAHTGNAATRHVAASVAFMASLGTLLVNANPLMRFDGYFILADWLEIPNLNMHGRRWLGSLAAHLLGCPVARLGLPPRAASVVKVYAVVAIVWRSIVWLALTTALVVILARLHSIAAVVGALATLLLAGRAALVSLRRWFKQLPACSPRRLYAFTTAGAVAIVITMIALLRPATISAPGIVEYFPLVVVRAASPGFVRELCIRDGDEVETGQKLLVIENRELLVQLRLAEIEVEKSIARCRLLLQASETAKEQAERSQQEALCKKRDELARQVRDLVVTAPVGGRIVGRNLDEWLDRHVETGTELFRIGDESAKEVMVAIAQDDVELFQAGETGPLRVHFAVGSAASLVATGISIEPRATSRAPHEALSSRLDGPLAVIVTDDAATDRTPADELLDPCFKASAVLTSEHSRRLRAGQRATVELRTSLQSWGRRSLAQIERWFDQQLATREARQ